MAKERWSFIERKIGGRASGFIVRTLDLAEKVVAIVPANPGERTHEEAREVAREIVEAHNHAGAA